MTPHADPFDGKLTLAFGYRATRLGLFQALPRAFNEDKGSYVEMEGMREVQTTRISIHLDKPSPAHTDGELLPDWIQDFEYNIFPRRLSVLARRKTLLRSTCNSAASSSSDTGSLDLATVSSMISPRSRL